MCMKIIDLGLRPRLRFVNCLEACMLGTSAVRLRGKNVEVRIATSVKNVGDGDEKAKGMRGMK